MFLKLVQEEMESSRKKHGYIRSAHEGLGILEEEFWELKLEVFKKKHDKQAMLSELVQVAAMCAKMAEDCKLIIDDTQHRVREGIENDYERYLEESS